MINEWDLTQTNQARILNQPPTVAVLGASAIEAHNYHLPEGCLLYTSPSPRD